MYDNLKPGNRINLTYGAKVRYIRAVSGLISTALKLFPNTYTKEELLTIDRILSNAKERAKEERDVAAKALSRASKEQG